MSLLHAGRLIVQIYLAEFQIGGALECAPTVLEYHDCP